MNATQLRAMVHLRRSISDSIQAKQALLQDSTLLQAIIDVGCLMATALGRGNRVILAGNGGSAADAQHLAAEFVSRFEFDRPGLPALSLATDTSMLTAIGNDYGYDQLFRRQLQAQARAGDVFVGITTSGRSKNILAALDACPALGVASVALCGQDGVAGATADHVLRMPSRHTARVQECHILVGHILCGHVEQALFADLAPRLAEAG